MLSLSPTLLAEQKKPSRKPLIKVEVQEYGHPQQSSSIQWSAFGWEKLYGGTETRNYHGCCISGDGSLHRIRLDGTTIFYSRVTNPGPGSTWNSWSNMGTTVANSHIAIAAQGNNVMMVSCSANYTFRRESSDNGASWGSWIQMSNTRPCDKGAAIAFKPNGDCIIVHATNVSDPTSLYLQRRTSGNWSSGLGQRTGDWDIYGLSAYYDGDWNIVALVLEGTYLFAYRMVYGDGYRQSAGTWATDIKLPLGRAYVDTEAMLPLRRFKRQPTWSRFEIDGETFFRSHTAPKPPPTWWENHQAVLQALVGESLSLSGVSLCKPPNYPALLCTSRTNVPWIFRLKPQSDFFDHQWTKAMFIDTLAPFGMALAASSSHLWATQANEVWRTALPTFWQPPTAGSGPGDKFTVPVSSILGVSANIRPLGDSTLTVTLDNSKGIFDSPGSGDLAPVKRGSRVNLFIGYKTSAGDEMVETARFFVDSMEHSRSPGRAVFTLHCVDAWSLLEAYSFSRPVEWNMSSDTYTVYDLIGLVLSSIGATLDYKSRSQLITTLYPKLEVKPGESAANVLRRLLDLVEDVIYFFGLAAFIVHPQSTDEPAYHFMFPIR